MRKWRMQTAKARFSEVVKYAQHEGPQDVTFHGQSVAVLISRDTYNKLISNDQTLVNFMNKSPLRGAENLVFDRDPSLTREEQM
ncbi:MAG TPA: type II toxin-antitoxin system prevent-host-death family antitoxin [Orrella sp.]